MGDTLPLFSLPFFLLLSLSLFSCLLLSPFLSSFLHFSIPFPPCLPSSSLLLFSTPLFISLPPALPTSLALSLFLSYFPLLSRLLSRSIFSTTIPGCLHISRRFFNYCVGLLLMTSFLIVMPSALSPFPATVVISHR